MASDKLARVLQELPGWKVVGTPILHRKTSFYKIAGPEGTAPQGLKIFHTKRAAELCYKAQNAAYKRQCPVFGLSVPQPLGLHKECMTVRMEWVAAPLASKQLLHRPYGRTRHQVLTRAGQWLKWFHAGADIQSAPYDPSGVMDDIARVWPEATNDRVLTQAQALLAQQATAGTVLGHGVLHGDFTPSNLFMESGRVLGIDFNDRSTGYVLADICRFLVYLSVYRLRPPTRSDLRAWGCARADIEAIAQGYGEGLSTVPSETFLSMQLGQLVRRLAALEGLRQGQKGLRLRRFIEVRRVRYMVRHAMQGLKIVA